MSTSKGYFSLVQYCPDAARQEAANIGVVLFCPEQQFFRARTSNSLARIHRFFGKCSDDPNHIVGMIEAFRHRIESERPFCKTLEDFSRFVNTRANKVILTPPKPIRVSEPVVDLEALYEELVAESSDKASDLVTGCLIASHLDALSENAEVTQYVSRVNETVSTNQKAPLISLQTTK